MLARGAVRGRSYLTAAILIAIITIVGFFNALRLASNLVQTSDSAQGFVVGHAIASGNVLLSGWHFPIDNFYFTDSIPYAAAEATAGARPYLMVVVPALAYACLILLAAVPCVRAKQPFSASLETVAATALVLVVPAWTGVWNPMLMSDMHTATVVAALAALVLFARIAGAESNGATGRFIAASAFLLVALAVASDPFSLVFAFVPGAAVLATEAVRNPRSPKIRFTLSLLAAAITTGLLLPWIIARLGGFTTENDLAIGFAPSAWWWANFVDVVFGILTLWGTNPLNVHGVSDALMFTIRWAELAFVLFTLIYVGRTHMHGGRLALLDRLLCAGAAVSLAACLPSAQFAKGVRPETMWQGGPPMRFLLPAVLFASIVVCRQLANAFDSLSRSRLRLHFRGALLVVAGLVLLTGAMPPVLLAGAPRGIDRDSAITAARWLEQHRLSQGAGEYWSANLLTAMSGAAVEVRSMVPDHGRLVPYVWAEAQAFYERPPQFAIWQEPSQTGWTEAFVRATWPVCAIRTVAGYHIALLPTSGKVATCSLP